VTDVLAPAPGHGWSDLHELDPPDRRVFAAVAATAIVVDLGVRSGVLGLAGALAAVVVAAGLLAGGRLRNRAAVPVVAAAPAFGAFLAVRTSPWVLPLDVLATCGLLVLGASLARAGDPRDLTVPNLLGRAVHALTHGVLAPAFLFRGRRVRSGRAGLLRGVALGAPVVLVVGALLASADPVFASFFRLPADVGDLIGHAVLLAIGAWSGAGLLRMASAPPFESPIAARRPLGATEALTVLAGLDVLFVAFAASQVVAAVRGASYVRRTAGLTYAEYARSGFFQLLAVAAVTLAVLLVLRASTDLRVAGERRRFTVLAEVAVVLTVAIVIGAVRRLHLYEAAYGLTMLRLCSALVAVWIGAVYVLLGVSLAGAGRRRAWLVPAAVVLALAGLLAADAVNLEAVVVHRNVDRFAGTDRLDVDALSLDLSDDAVPALVDSLAKLPPDQAASLRSRICAGPRTAPGGFWASNVARNAAVAARRRACT
jgi:hypothetical protein